MFPLFSMPREALVTFGSDRSLSEGRRTNGLTNDRPGRLPHLQAAARPSLMRSEISRRSKWAMAMRFLGRHVRADVRPGV